MKILLFLFAAMAFAQTPALPPSYVLGPDDQVVIHVLDSDEIGASPFRIDMRGSINVPLAGRLQAAGLTVDQLEAALAARLKEYLQTPVVTVPVSNFAASRSPSSAPSTPRASTRSAAARPSSKSSPKPVIPALPHPYTSVAKSEPL
jgi:hypothetical protein